MRFTILAPLFVVATVAACSVSSEGDSGDFESSAAGVSSSSACSMSRSQLLAATSSARRRAIERGFTWLDANVSYNQGRSRAGYRTDCSGFISMCWELGTSYTTSAFSDGDGEASRLGSFDELLPGDALVRRSGSSGHIVLFLGWNDDAQRGACVLEQASTASDMEFRVRSTSSLENSGYRPIRADRFADDTSSSSASDSGDYGDSGDDEDGYEDNGGYNDDNGY
jgi:uncharacterized protein YfaT (DUF1175 family)